jgi:hypothetical protein
VMDVGNKLRSAFHKHVEEADEGVDESVVSDILSEVDHVEEWLAAAAPRPAARVPAPYEFSVQFEEYYRDRSQGGMQNSERYHQEQRELTRQGQQRQQEEEGLRRRAQGGRRGGSTSAGMSTAALLGEERDTSESEQLQSPRRDTVSQIHESAGSRVWGNPTAGGGESRIPTASAGRARKSSGTKQNSPPAAGSRVPMKRSTQQDIQLQGHSLGATAAPPAQPATTAQPLALDSASRPTDDALGFSAAAVRAASTGNLLTTAGTTQPRSNSSRMTPSQADALRKIQEAKRRNSMHVGVVNTANAGSGRGASGPVTVGNRKVMNYANWMEHSAT